MFRLGSRWGRGADAAIRLAAQEASDAHRDEAGARYELSEALRQCAYHDLTDRLAAFMPESWDGEDAFDAIAIEFVGVLAARLAALGGTVEKYDERPDGSVFPDARKDPNGYFDAVAERRAAYTCRCPHVGCEHAAPSGHRYAPGHDSVCTHPGGVDAQCGATANAAVHSGWAIAETEDVGFWTVSEHDGTRYGALGHPIDPVHARTDGAAPDPFDVHNTEHVGVPMVDGCEYCAAAFQGWQDGQARRADG